MSIGPGVVKLIVDVRVPSLGGLVGIGGLEIFSLIKNSVFPMDSLSLFLV